MKTLKWLLVLLTYVSLTLPGCSRKSPPNKSPQITQPPPQKKIPEANLPELLYAGEINKLGLEISKVLNEITTIEEAKQAIITLTPLAKEYKDLKIKFTKYYLQNRGPLFNKLNNHPRNVQKAVIVHLQKSAKQEHDTLYNFYCKNLPKKLKNKVSDTSGFSAPFPFGGQNSPSVQWYKCMDTPYIPPKIDPNTFADPNAFYDPNTLQDPNSFP